MKPIKIKLKKKGKVWIIILSVLALSVALFGSIHGKINARKNVNCSMFKTQKEAQVLFNTNPKKYQILDKNYNNIACENLLD